MNKVGANEVNSCGTLKVVLRHVLMKAVATISISRLATMWPKRRGKARALNVTVTEAGTQRKHQARGSIM